MKTEQLLKALEMVGQSLTCLDCDLLNRLPLHMFEHASVELLYPNQEEIITLPPVTVSSMRSLSSHRRDLCFRMDVLSTCIMELVSSLEDRPVKTGGTKQRVPVIEDGHSR